MRNESYFDEYRQKKQELESMRLELKTMYGTVSDLKDKMVKTDLEIIAMIELNIDSPEVRLREVSTIEDDHGVDEYETDLEVLNAP